MGLMCTGTRRGADRMKPVNTTLYHWADEWGPLKRRNWTDGRRTIPPVILKRAMRMPLNPMGKEAR